MDYTGYTVIVLYLLILVGIGWWCSRKQNSLSDFLLAGRNIPAWAALAAVVATETSAVTFIGAPAISFKEGGDLSFLQVILGYVFARFIIAFVFLPKFFEHELVTIYQYLGKVFGVGAQRTAGIFFFITRALAAGVRHYAAALVVSAVIEVDLTFAIVVTGFVSLVYAWLGGLSAVIWTEVFQFLVMMAGAVMAFCYLLDVIPGGWNEVVQTGSEAGKFAMLHWDWGVVSPYYFFAGMLGGFCLNLASHGADQDLVQRLLSCRGLRSAQSAMILSGFVVFVQFAFFLVIGVMLYTHYGTLPDELEKTDQILPYFVMQTMPSAAAAVVIAAILSAALSSTASALNSLSSTAVTDFVVAFQKEEPSQTMLVNASRWFTVFWTIVLVIIAILAQNSESILDTGLSIPSYTYGSLLGIFTPVRNATALIIAMIVGVVIVLGLSFNDVHWTWFVPAGAMTTVLLAFGISMTMKQQPNS
jgi:SSS family transporter